MPKIYTSPTKTMSSLLIHTGALDVNQTDGGTIPDEFISLGSIVAVGSNQIVNEVGQSTSNFTHFDAGIIQAANYDEVIVDILPVVTYVENYNGGQISMTGTMPDFAQIAATGKPFWIMVHVDGYGVSQLYATATLAIQTALNAVTAIYSTLQSALLLPNFKGFAFLRPDLNVYYTDNSFITRTQQNLLVQACWNLSCACCFVTTRPYDIMTLIGPNLVNDTNQNSSLAHPILGCNPAYNDKLVICYPSIRATAQNISIVLGQSVALVQANNRDPGFTLNLTYSYVLPTDDSFWIADGTGGVTPASASPYTAFETTMQNIFNFLGALGYLQMGLFGVFSTGQSITGANIPAPLDFLPSDSAVNTTGSFAAWGDSGDVYVAYSNGNGGNTVRQFSSSFVETIPYTGTIP